MPDARSRGQSGMVRDATTNLAAMSVAMVGGVINQAVLAWCLGPELRGEFGIWIAVAAVLGIVFTLGTDRANQVLMISGRITVPQAVTCQLAMVVLGFGLTTVAGPLILSLPIPVLVRLAPPRWWPAVLVVPTILLNVGTDFLLVGLRRFHAVVVLNVLRTLLQLCCNVLFLGYFAWGVQGAWTALFAASAMTGLCALIYLRRLYGVPWSLPPAPACRELVRYAVRYLPARLGNVVNGHLVLLTLALIATKRDVGVFSLAAVLMGRLLILPESLNRALLPRFGSRPDASTGLVADCCRVTFPLLGAIVLIVLILGSYAVPIVFSAGFADSVAIMWLLAPGIWIRGACKPLYPFFVATGRPTVVSAATLVESVVTCCSLVTLYPVWGIHGATVAASIGSIASTAVLMVAFRWITGVNLLGLWSRDDGRRLLDALFGVLARHRRLAGICKTRTKAAAEE